MAENKNKLTDEQKIAYKAAMKQTLENMKDDKRYIDVSSKKDKAEEISAEASFQAETALGDPGKQQKAQDAKIESGDKTRDVEDYKKKYIKNNLQKNFKEKGGKGKASEVESQMKQEAKKEKSITNKIKKFASKMVDKLTKKSSKKTNTGPGSSPVGKKQEAKKGKGRT